MSEVIKYTYSPDLDMHYVYLTERAIAGTIRTDCYVDIDADGQIVGFEIFGIKEIAENE